LHSDKAVIDITGRIYARAFRIDAGWYIVLNDDDESVELMSARTGVRKRFSKRKFRNMLADNPVWQVREIRAEATDMVVETLRRHGHKNMAKAVELLTGKIPVR